MRLWVQMYLVVAVCTLAWLLYGVYVALRDGHIRITDGPDDDENKKFLWRVIGTMVHGAIASAVVWPITLPMQLWTMRQQAESGGPAKLTFSSMHSHYPAREQLLQQREAIVAACNEALSTLPDYTNEFVLADTLFFIAARQALAKSRKLNLSDDSCREHLTKSVAWAFDTQVKGLDAEQGK